VVLFYLKFHFNRTLNYGRSAYFSLKAIPPISTDATIAWSVRLSVRTMRYGDCTRKLAETCKFNLASVTLVHPAKAVGRNEMPFGRDTLVVATNTVLDRGPGPPREGEI